MEPKVDKNTDFYKYVDCFSRTAHIPTVCVFEATDHRDSDITITIPTFKRIDTLEETLESALHQDGYDDYQIYVVDNNPERNDETEVFMQKYKGGRVSYFKNTENLGLCGNWNRCFTLAKSKWVCLLHDDDTIRPEFFATMVPYLTSLPDVGILQSLKYRDRHNGKEFNIHHKRNVELFDDFDLCQGHIIDAPTGTFYKREAVIELGGFNIDYSSSLDYCFNTLLTYKHKTYVVNKPLTWYREGTTNYSKQQSTQINWAVFDWYLIHYLLSRHHIPSIISYPYLELEMRERVERSERIWGQPFVIPYDLLQWKGYPLLWSKACKKIIKALIKINHCLIQRSISRR